MPDVKIYNVKDVIERLMPLPVWDDFIPASDVIVVSMGPKPKMNMTKMLIIPNPIIRLIFPFQSDQSSIKQKMNIAG